MKPFLPPVPVLPEQYDTLVALAGRCLDQCRTRAIDGTVLFRPDGSGNYDAMWTRDFAYMVEGAGALLDPAEILAAIDYLLAAQREDGAIPDRRQADGTPVYLAGPVDRPLGESCPTDNPPFIVKAMAGYVRITGDHAAFLARRAALYRAMESVPLSEDGLVQVDPNRPHSSYGFVDCVAQTGNVLFGSLLYWEGCQHLAKLCARAEYHDEAHEWYEQAEHTSRRLGDLYDEEFGMFRAASVDCRQLDLWGSLYACVIRVATKTQAHLVADFFKSAWDMCVYQGHLRHLVRGEYWDRLLAEVPRNAYQNGGYWAVPVGWLAQTIHLSEPDVARELIAEVVEQMRDRGVYEWIDSESGHVPGYVASVANVLGAVQSSRKLARGNSPASAPHPQ